MRRAFASALLVSAVVLTVPAQYPGAVFPPTALAPGFDSITSDSAKDILGFLAGPETAGRGTGQPGFQKAADFVAAKFKRWGLKPVGDDGGYFQKQSFTRSRIKPDSVTAEIEGTDVRFGPSDLVFTNSAGNIDISGPIVVVQAKPGPLGDAATLENKVVLVTGEPEPRLRFQINRSGAKAILYVKDALPPSEWSVRRAGGDRPGRTSSPVGSITAEAAKKLLEASVANGPAAPANLTLRGAWETETVMVPNVVGLLPGSDPTLKAQIIGIGAHLDHLGTQGGVVYPGADDDGSGSTAVLLIARAMAANPIKPKRSILFMTFCGEEMGLLGSGYYSDHPIFPHDRMIAELQMDMVGRDSDGAQNGDVKRMDVRSENMDTIRLVGSKRISTELDDIIQEENKHIGFRFKYDAEDVYTRSDHYNFAKKGIPIAFLFDGFHPDYHQPTDTIDKIDWRKLTSAAKLYYLTAMELANRPEPPKKNG